MKVYLAGPMTGIPHHNFPLFDEARDMLKGKGYTVISPADMSRELGIDGTREVTEFEYQSCLKDDIKAILRMDAVVVLPGWGTSKGARLEAHIAQVCGIPVLDYISLKNGESVDEAKVIWRVVTQLETTERVYTR